MSDAIVTHDAVSGAVVRALVPIAAGQPIYDERMLQDFTEPCFFVIETSVTESPDYDRYLWRTHHIEVSYFPKTQAMTDRKALSSWRLMLLEYLEKIYVNATEDSNGNVERLPVYAQNPECRFVEDHITYYATYKLHCVNSVASGGVMNTLRTQLHIKNQMLEFHRGGSGVCAQPSGEHIAAQGEASP